MKAHSARFDNRRRPHWWSALLSLLVALALVVPPTCLCAITQAAPGHSHFAVQEHSHSHQGASDEHAKGHYDVTHHKHSPAAFSLVPAAHVCCCDSDGPPVVMAPALRSAASGANLIALSLAPATLPAMQDIFALTNCLGRDGPPDQPLRSQLLPSSLLGRAPPVSV